MDATLRLIAHNVARQINPAFMLTGALIIAAASGAALLLRRWARGRELLRRLNGADRALFYAMVLLAVAWTGVYSYLSIQRYYKLLCRTWDLAIFETVFYNALGGRFLQDFRGPYDHFSPLLALMLPVYAIWRDPRTLLVLQAVVAAAAVWPLYLLARDVSGRRSIGAAAAIMYLLYPFLSAGTLYDFHALCLTPVCFFSLLLFMRRRNWKWYWVSLAALFFVKESEAILSLGVGLYLISLKDYKRGALTAALSVAWFFAATRFLLPWTNGAPYRHMGRYAGLGDIAGWALTTEEGVVTAAAYCARVMAVLAFVIVPTGFLVLRRLRPFILIACPYLAVNFLSSALYQNIFFGHYTFTLSAVVMGFVALSLDSLPGVDRYERPSMIPLYMLAVAALSNLMFSWPANERFIYPTVRFDLAKSYNLLSMPFPLTSERRDFYRVRRRERFMLAARDLIPKGATVMASRNTGYLFAGGYTLLDLDIEKRADFYIFDFRTDDKLHTPPETYVGLLRRIENDASVVKFVNFSSPGKYDDIVFFAQDSKWLDFYRAAQAALDREPGNAAYRDAAAAVERALGLAAAPPRP